MFFFFSLRRYSGLTRSGNVHDPLDCPRISCVVFAYVNMHPPPHPIVAFETPVWSLGLCTHGCEPIVVLFSCVRSVSGSRLDQRPAENRADACRSRRREEEKSERDQQGERVSSASMHALYIGEERTHPAHPKNV